MRTAICLPVAVALSIIFFNALIVAAQTTGCKDYYSKGIRAPAVENIKDVISVPDGFPLGDLTVTLDVSHRRIGALVVTLTAQPPAATGAASANRTVILKERGLGRLGDNMYMTTFADTSEQSFPVPAEAAPFRGVFRPTQRLSFFSEDAAPGTIIAGAGGTKGDWTLRIEDVAPNATIRPIALNSWKLHLCPMSQQNSVPLPPVTVPSTPTTNTNTNTQPAPTGSSITQPVNGFDGPSPAPAPVPKSGPIPSSRPLFGGWQMVTNPADGSQVQAFDGQSGGSTGTTAPPAIPPVTVPGTNGGLFNGLNVNMADPFGLRQFQNNFNAYLQGRFGAACTDPTCQNIKLKFWKATLGLAYMKARLNGKLDSAELINKLADFIPGDNPILGKFSDVASNWEANRTEILRNLSLWFDKIQQYMAGNTAGLESLLTSAMSGGGALKSLGIDPATAMSALGPMLGLDNPDDAKALMDGLNEAGFNDMLKDFLDPSAFMFR